MSTTSSWGCSDLAYGSLSWDDRRVAGSHDFPCRDFELRRHDRLVRALDSRRASTHQLSGAEAGQDDEFEGVDIRRTVDHKPSQICFGEGWRPERPQNSGKRRPSISDARV